MHSTAKLKQMVPTTVSRTQREATTVRHDTRGEEVHGPTSANVHACTGSRIFWNTVRVVRLFHKVIEYLGYFENLNFSRIGEEISLIFSSISESIGGDLSLQTNL